jgi:glycosyltransferase involved in cell wall biosynthesis
MSYKKPVVAFDVDGVREAIIHDRNGYLVPFGDIDLMSIYLLSLINDKSLIQKMGEEGYALFQEKFRLETMAKETYQIYKELSA